MWSDQTINEIAKREPLFPWRLAYLEYLIYCLQLNAFILFIYLNILNYKIPLKQVLH